VTPFFGAKALEFGYNWNNGSSLLFNPKPIEAIGKNYTHALLCLGTNGPVSMGTVLMSNGVIVGSLV